MKKTYHVPELRVHGSVEEITGAFGDEAFTDTIFMSDGVSETDRGSVDGILVPCPDSPNPELCA